MNDEQCELVAALAFSNYGHFSSMLIENGNVRGLSLHFECLRRDCEFLFQSQLDLSAIRAALRDLADQRKDVFVARVTVTDPKATLGTIGDKLSPEFFINTRNLEKTPSHPLSVQAVQFTRSYPHVKHVGLFGSLYQRRISQLNGFDDALFVGKQGDISEGCTWNIGFYDGERVVLPKANYLSGVTVTLLKQHTDIEFVERSIRIDELPAMRAIFATNAVVGVRWIHRVNDLVWTKEDPVIEQFRRAYLAIDGEVL